MVRLTGNEAALNGTQTICFGRGRWPPSDCLDFAKFSIVLIFAVIEFGVYFGICVHMCVPACNYLRICLVFKISDALNKVVKQWIQDVKIDVGICWYICLGKKADLGHNEFAQKIAYLLVYLGENN